MLSQRYRAAGPILGLLVFWMGLLLLPGTSSGGPGRALPRSPTVVSVQASLTQTADSGADSGAGAGAIITAAAARPRAEADAPEDPISLDDHESERAADTSGARTAACESPAHAVHHVALPSAPLRFVQAPASIVGPIVDRRDPRGPPRVSSCR